MTVRFLPLQPEVSGSNYGNNPPGCRGKVAHSNPSRPHSGGSLVQWATLMNDELLDEGIT